MPEQPVTDPALLKQLNAPPVAALKPVTDPALLKQLNAKGTSPNKPLVPQPQGPTPPGTPGNPLLIQSLARQAVKPITDILGEYSREIKQTTGQMGLGAKQLATGKPWEMFKGAGNVALGGMGYLGAPINAPWHTIVEQPVEKATGSPLIGNIAEFIAGLALPGVGIAGDIAKARAPLDLASKPILDAFKVHLSPETLSPEGEAAGGTIRAAQGTRFRDTASTAAALEPFHRAVNALPEAERWQFADYVEGRSEGAERPAGDLGHLADIMRDAVQQRQAKLAALPSKAKMEFVKDYLAHFWQDSKAEDKINRAGGGQGKQGSAASLKKRSIPTYAKGIAAGLKPLTSDPIEITMRYVRSMDRYIAAQDVLDTAKSNGTVKYFRPTVQGASGHPDPLGHNVEPSGPIPEGWMELRGRGATNETGQTAYAPADWARVYNNFISRGFHEHGEDLGNAVDALQHASNSITGLELGLSGYHALNVATSAAISDVGRAISNIVGGRPLKGLKVLGRSFTAPVSMYLRGRKLEQIYLGRTPGTPNWRRAIDLAAKAGSRGVGKRHASDYEFSAMGSYWTSIKRGAFKQEAAQSWQNVKDRPIAGGAKEVFRLVGRVMETFSKPLFEDYIPRVKNAALYDLINDWVEANPKASYDEQLAMARKMVDAMDDRFGEMIQDNIFWNKVLKQSAQIEMRSYSWTLGLFRQLAKTVSDPRRLSIGHPNYNPSLAATLAGAIAIPMLNLSYFYLKQLSSILAGNPPKEPALQDAIAPRSGGRVPGFGGRSTVPERVLLPSHERDIFGWWFNPKQEAANKQARFMEMIEEWLSGNDRVGHPYMDPDASAEMQVMQWLEHLAGGLTPISLGTLAQGHKKGSTLGIGAATMGVREAPKYLEDPTGYKHGMNYIAHQAYKKGQKSLRKQQNQYVGSQE